MRAGITFSHNLWHTKTLTAIVTCKNIQESTTTGRNIDKFQLIGCVRFPRSCVTCNQAFVFTKKESLITGQVPSFLLQRKLSIFYCMFFQVYKLFCLCESQNTLKTSKYYFIESFVTLFHCIHHVFLHSNNGSKFISVWML